MKKIKKKSPSFKEKKQRKKTYGKEYAALLPFYNFSGLNNFHDLELPPKGSTITNIGIGFGRVEKELNRLGNYNLQSVDIDSSFFGRVNRISSCYLLNDVKSMPKSDLVICHMFVEQFDSLDNLEFLFDNINLKKGAVFSLQIADMMYNDEGLSTLFKRQYDNGTINFYSFGEVRKLIKKSKLKLNNKSRKSFSFPTEGIWWGVFQCGKKKENK